jgi:predicted acetyltransferase
MRLLRPTIKYKRSFQNALREFAEEGSKEGNISNVEKYIKESRQHSKGVNLPKGYVSETVYWLIDDNQFVGRVGIRHYLSSDLKKLGGHIGYAIRPSKRKKGYGTQILKLALLKAKKLGIKKLLITCDENNIASRKIIESNGGKFKDKLRREDGITRRYWIKLRSN